MIRFVLAIILSGLTSIVTAEDSLTDADREYKQFEEKVKTQLPQLDHALEKNPSPEQFSQRGDLRFAVGQYKEALSDYQAWGRSSPANAANNWRLGLACYYAGEHQQGVEQFASTYKEEKVDSENALWHYFCLVKLEGLEKASPKMLPTSPLDRAPFPEICQMFRGELAPKDLLEKVETSPNDANKSLRLFNAHLYVGIYHDLHGETKESLRLLRLAVNDPRPAAFGQAYMHRLARCHYEMLLAAERK